MTNSAHLNDEAISDVLIGLASAESEAHLAVCADCRNLVGDFQSDIQLFNRNSLAWSEARSASMGQPVNDSRTRRSIFAPAALAFATLIIAIVGLLVWNHESRMHQDNSARTVPTNVAAPEDNAAQIEQDNQLMRSVDLALNSTDDSEILADSLVSGMQEHSKRQRDSRSQ